MTNSTDEKPLLQGKIEYVTRWWFQATSDIDCYDLFVVRYDSLRKPDGEISITRCMAYSPYSRDEDGIVMGTEGWTEYQQGERIQPAYRFPGHILHLFLTAGLFLDRESIVENLKELAINVFESVATAQAKENDAWTDIPDSEVTDASPQAQ